MVLLHPQKPTQENDESWTRKGDKKEMMKFYKGWNETVRNFLSCKWEFAHASLNMARMSSSHMGNPQMSLKETSWNGRSTPTALCLPGTKTRSASLAIPVIPCKLNPRQPLLPLPPPLISSRLPYVAQGAAQAMEDGAVLQAVLSQITTKSGIPTALKVYELVRKERGEKIQNSASTTRTSLHLPDGPEQQQRDEQIRKAARGEGENPDKWADTDWQRFMWGTDVMRDVVEGWEELKMKVEGTHHHGALAAF